MDAADRLVERNGTAAEKFCHYIRYQNDDKATEVLSSLLPGDHIEIPLDFIVSHEIYLISNAQLNYNFEGNFDSLENLEAALNGSTIDFDNLHTISYSWWCVNLNSGKFHTSNNISIKLLEELSNGPYKSIAKCANFFIRRREEEEKERKRKEEQRQKQIEANNKALARRNLENRCYSLFLADAGNHYYNAWVVYNEAIKYSSRKDFAVAIQSSPFRSAMFLAHDDCARTQPDFNRVLEQLTNEELRKIAVEIYGGQVRLSNANL